MERYSTLIDGTIVMDSNMIKKRGGVGQSELFLIPMSFILRRLVFVLSLVLDSTLSGQIIVTLVSMLLILSLLLRKRLIDSKMAYTIEIINEVTVLLICYMIMGYSFFVFDGAIKYKIGKSQIWLVVTNIGVNLIYVIWNTIKSIILCCRKRQWRQWKLCCCCKQKIAQFYPSESSSSS